ncbi:MAG: tetratricopeptide repeat protein [Bacteroides sp.]|nr:tetratricopeptide repeat protein [Bacteroides sp.]
MKNVLLLFCVLAACPFLYAQDAELEDYQNELVRAEKLKNRDSIAAAYCHLGEYYAYRSADSALYYAEKGLETLATKPSSLHTTLLNNIGDAYFTSGNLDKAFHYFSMARHEARELKDTALWASSTASLGVVYRQKENPDSALICYNEALDLLEGRDDYSEQAQVLSSIAILYGTKSRLDESVAYGKRAVEAAAKSKDMDMIMYANYTCCSAYFLQRRHDESIAMLRAVIDEAVRQQKPVYALKGYTTMLEMFKSLGMRDSIDFYVKKAETVVRQLPENSQEALGYLEELSLICMEQGRYRESLNIQMNLLKRQGEGTHMPIDKLYLMIARNYRNLKETEKAMYYYDRAYQIGDSLYAERVNQELSDMTVKYDTKEKELEIARLNQAQLEQKAQTMRWIIATTVVVFVFLLSVLYYMLRRKRIRKEEELKLAQSYIDGLERERTRLAKDLHDGVCNDLLGIGMQMQCLPPTGEAKQELLGMLEQVRSDVRSISHELMPPKFLHATLAETAEAYVGRLAVPSSVQLAFSQEDEGAEWRQVPEQVAYEVYRILQELLSNVLKHSGATEIYVNLSLREQLLTLQITNNGKNYSNTGEAAAGIGLITIRERAKTVGGLLTTEIQSGRQLFKLEISLPI